MSTTTVKLSCGGCGSEGEFPVIKLVRIADTTRQREEIYADGAETVSDSPLDLDVLIEALVRPDVEAACVLDGRSRGSARLIGAIYIRPAEFVRERVEDHFRPVAERFLPHLTCSLPDLPRDILSWRVRWCVFGMVGALMSDEVAPFASDSEELIARLVAVSVAGVSAGASV